MLKPLPSLDRVYQIVLQEEKQRSLSASVSISGNSAAFHSFIPGDFHKTSQFQQKVYNQGSSRFSSIPKSGIHQPISTNSGSYKVGKKSSSDKNFQERRTYFCDHCKIPGHSTQRCFKLHGYPPGHRLYKGRRVAAVAQTEAAAEGSSTNSPALTTEQYN